MKRWAWVLVLFVLAAPLAEPLVGTPVRAQDSVETEQRKRLEEVKRQADEKRRAAAALKPKETRALGELRRTDKELAQTRRRLKLLQSRQQTLGAQLEVTRANLDRSIQALDTQRVRLRRRLRSMYKYGPARDLEYVLSTASFAQLMTRWDFLNMVAEQDRVLFEGVRQQKEQVETAQEQLQSHLSEVQQNEKKTTKENAKLANLRQQKATTVASIQSQRQAYEAAAAELERTARRIQSLLAQLERRRRDENDKAKGEGRNPQPYAGDFAKGQGQLDWPVRGEVVGRFGLETHPRFGTQIHNDGLDIAVPVGTNVRAVAKGRVDVANDDFEGMGGMVVINHGDGYYTLYGHLSDVLVHNAQEVQPGAVIGRSGDAGSLKGPIVHFEVRKGSSPLDPKNWLR